MEQKNTLYLAPMEGLTTFVYRNAFHKYYGGIDTYFSPFLSNTKLSTKEINDVCPSHNDTLTLIPQVLTNRADVFLSLANQLMDMGYRELNLNLGCPSGTVVAKHRGAGFLEDTLQLQHFFDEIFEKCPLRISVKTRIGIDSLDEWPLILKVYRQYPFSEMIIHPRLQKEYYQGLPHKEAFLEAEKILGYPLCYNGNITEANHPKILQEAGIQTHTYMLGRGLLSNPTLANCIKKIPSNDAEPQTTFRAFHDEILEGYLSLMSGDQPVLYRMKELWTYMGNYLSLDEKQQKKIKKCNSVSEYKGLILRFIDEGNFQASVCHQESK